MRLNRNSAIFIALLAVVIIVAVIFLRGDGSNEPSLDIEATSETIALFPGVQPANIISVSVVEVREVGDTRPTPIPGNATLEPPTPLPDGVDPATTTEVATLTRDSALGWVVADTTTQTVTGTVNNLAIESALASLPAISSNSQFIPPEGNYEQYGLAGEPNYDVTFVVQPVAGTGVASEGDQSAAEPITYRLRIGNRTVNESGFYAFLNDDSQTVYVINNAAALQNGILNLTTQIPVEIPPTPTTAPILNTGAPFATFLLNNIGNFTFTNNVSGEFITITRNADLTWNYVENGIPLQVQPETLQVILNSFMTVQGIQQTDIADLSTVGLDSPDYVFEAQTSDGLTTYRLQLGDQDPTGGIYYALVNDFSQVLLVNANSVSLLISLFDSPPLLVPPPETTAESTAAVEATAEATADAQAGQVEVTAEATAEMTESPAEATADAQAGQVEMTPEATVEMTEEPMEATEAVEIDRRTEMEATEAVEMTEEPMEATEAVEMTEEPMEATEAVDL